jgi:hypothetical protein
MARVRAFRDGRVFIEGLLVVDGIQKLSFD